MRDSIALFSGVHFGGDCLFWGNKIRGFRQNDPENVNMEKNKSLMEYTWQQTHNKLCHLSYQSWKLVDGFGLHTW